METLTASQLRVSLSKGKLEKGGFTIDMNSIACSDLTDNTLNAMLVGHLKTSDFFQVAEHSTANFVMTAATPITGVTDGTDGKKPAIS